MRASKLTLVVLVALAIGLLPGCGNSQKDAPRITGGGATFVDPLMQVWAAEYKKAKNVDIDYVAKGSGYGISNVTSRNVDFGCSDAPMNAKEVDAAKKAVSEVVHIPVTIGAVAVIYNVPGLSKPLTLNAEVIGRIYLREVTKWNDDAIARLNEGVSLPDLPITPVFRAESSGTSNIFTEYLSREPKLGGKIKPSKEPKWPAGGIGQQQNAGVAKHVKENEGCIGYVELSFAKDNSIPYATLRNRRGKDTQPDTAGVTAAVEAAMASKPNTEPYNLHELAFPLTDADADAAYPLVGVSYAILFKKQPKDKGPVIVEFLKWVVTEGQKFAADKHYSPLPESLSKKAVELLDTVTFE